MEPILTIIALVAIGAAATYLLRRRRFRVWRAFARRHGLRFRGPKGKGTRRPAVKGSIDGREVVLAVSRESSDTGVLGIEEERLEVGLKCDVPTGLEIVQRVGVEELLDLESFTTGDDAFDARARVVADEPEAARAFLTADRREALRRLLEGAEGHISGLERGRLFIRRRTGAERIELLDDMLERLLRCADEIDDHEVR